MNLYILHTPCTELINPPCINQQERSNNEPPVLTVTSSGKTKQLKRNMKHVNLYPKTSKREFFRNTQNVLKNEETIIFTFFCIPTFTTKFQKKNKWTNFEIVILKFEIEIVVFLHFWVQQCLFLKNLGENCLLG